jgi:hypothetical protein
VLEKRGRVKKARQSNYNFFSALTDKLFSLEKQEVVNFWHPRLLLASVLSSVVIHGDAFFLFFPARPLCRNRRGCLTSVWCISQEQVFLLLSLVKEFFW